MEAAKIQESLMGKLSRATLSADEARDGILECFCVTNRKFREKGARLLGKDLTEEEMDAISQQMFRRLFTELGVDYSNPSREGLAQVKARMDEQLRYREHDPALVEQHDMACRLLIEKVR